VQANLQSGSSTTVSSNPFALPAPPSGPAKEARPPAYRAEALALAANILGSAGVVGFRMLDGENGFADAAWQSNRLFGMVRIEPKEPPAKISAIAIAVDAAGCKSKFASGSMPATDKNELPRIFTKCGDGEGWTVYYFILPRKAGGHYLIGTGANGADEPARQIESDIRQATLKATER
jgi:hypothetical protein